MRRLVLTPTFKRAYRKFTKHDATIRKRIDSTIEQMQMDVFAPKLGTHKLSGVLQGLWASSCGYDCRIVFSLESDTENQVEVIVLLDVGSHEEVY